MTNDRNLYQAKVNELNNRFKKLNARIKKSEWSDKLYIEVDEVEKAKALNEMYFNKFRFSCGWYY